MKIRTLHTWIKRLSGRQPPIDSDLITRNALKHYIQGKGIEIGPLHRPLDLSGLPVSQIRYVDRRSTQELRQTYPELAGYPLTAVDVVDDGEVLANIPDQSLDFIVANHLIEHTRDPVGTIANWQRKLASEGVIFLTIPDRNATFDSERSLTTLEHLIEDYRSNREAREARDRQHFEEWARFVDKLAPSQVEERADFLQAVDYSIHFHTFTLASFLTLVEYLTKELGFPFRLIACADTLFQGDEFVVVLKRN